MSIAKLKSLGRNLGLLVASTMLSLLLAEWTVKTFYPQQLAVWYSMEDGMVIHPPGLTTYLAEFKREVRFNSMGMRDREHVRKKDGTIRILVFGDSFMEALQVNFEDSFPSLLESGLRQALRRDVEVVNCAVSGWGQDDQLAYLTRYARELEPDLILAAMTLHNDVLDNMEEQFHALVDDRLVPKPVNRIPPSELRILRVKGFLASRSHLWQLLRKLKSLGEIRIAGRALNTHVFQLMRRNGETNELRRGWKVTFELFKAMREAGQGMNAETAIMLIPLRLQLEDDALEKFRVSAGMSMDEIAVEKPQQVMKAFGQAANIEVIDLLPAFRRWTVERRASGKGASLHLNEGHWNVSGHALAARVVVDELVRRRIVRDDKPAGTR